MIKADTTDLFQYKFNFKKYIMDRSVSRANRDPQSQESYNKSNFYSFLTMKKNYEEFDKPEKFFTTAYKKNILDIPMTGTGLEPWSSTYFPMRNALLAVRYDRGPKNTIGVWDSKLQKFSYKYTYQESKAKFKQPEDLQKVIDSQSDLEKYINDYFSAAEKYDFVTNDTQFTMTNWMRWKSDQFVKKGDIPSWYGICHGWTVASYYYTKPMKPVTLIAADGKTRVTFLPQDIMGLASQFWANADYQTRFVGSPCPYEDSSLIEKDPMTGIYTDPKCASLNPGAFITIVGNQIGIRKLNMNFDPNPDGEIWNQPIKSYSFDWYNLEDNYIYSKLEDNYLSMNAVKSSKNDFLKFVYKQATSEVVSVVGAYIQITYTVETEATKSSTPSPNAFRTGEYLAAVFLDKNGNIVGGVWKYNIHPNFAWKHEETVPPKGYSDDQVTSFTGSSSSLRNVAPYARSAARYGQPLKKIVDYLVEKSR
jgi:hypothetical protein